MFGSRTATALVGLAVSLAVSVAAWVLFDALFVFLLVPFVPLLLRGERPPLRRCPACGFETRAADVQFCPRDGTELE